MDEDNDTTVVAPADTSGDTITAPADTAAPRQEQTPSRPRLTDEEQLNVLEGRATRLRTKLGLPKEAPAAQSSTPDELIQKTYLRAANITADDEVELALTTAKKWGLPIDKIVDDEDFQAKLEKLRTAKSNELASSAIPGSPGARSANQTAEFYIARGTPPTREEVPDRKTRTGIARAMMDGAKNGRKFYNDPKPS